MPSGTRRTIPFALLLAAAFSWASADARAGEESAVPLERVRVTDAALRGRLDDGLRHSPTLRRLVDELRQSDVIVHIAPRASGRDAVGGELRFVATSAGVRYLRIGVREDLARPRVIAMLAHELQHAVEVAAAASVVDETSLDGLYHSIGYRVGTHRHETDAARRIAEQVLREIARAGRVAD